MAKKIIITIGREFGTGGRKIAMELGQRLGINVYDKRLLDSVKEHYNLTYIKITTTSRVLNHINM